MNFSLALKLPIDILKNIENFNLQYDQKKHTYNYLAEFGNLNGIKWLHANRNERCTKSAMNFAAEKGHLDVVKWLHYNRKEGCTTYAMDYAALNGHFNVVKWLHCNRKEGCTAHAMGLAAANGHLDIVKWLHNNYTESRTKYAMRFAAEMLFFKNNQISRAKADLIGEYLFPGIEVTNRCCKKLRKLRKDSIFSPRL